MAVYFTVRNPYRSVGSQAVNAYCIARVSEDNPDAGSCVVTMAAYEAACTKAQRVAREIKAFDENVKHDLVQGADYQQYFALSALEGSNPIKQAYLWATRSVLDTDGQETNAWATAQSDES